MFANRPNSGAEINRMCFCPAQTEASPGSRCQQNADLNIPGILTLTYTLMFDIISEQVKPGQK